MTINELLRQRVRRRANALCEYCHSPERISSIRFTVDHLKPRSLGGSDEFDNLALACSRCNQRRYNFTAGRDRETASITELFNPRQQAWASHFTWSANKVWLLGITPTGRATCDRLDVNDARYSGDNPITEVRMFWLKAGWHPPEGNPVEPSSLF